MKISLILSLVCLLFLGCVEMPIDYLFEPQTISLQSSSATVSQAGAITLKASVLFDNGAWCCQEATVNFYKGDSLIGTDAMRTEITPQAPKQGPSFSYEQTLNFASSQDNGTHTYKAVVVFYSTRGKTNKSIASTPISVVVNIP